IGQRDIGAALGEAGDATLAFAADAVAVRRVDVGQLDLAVEAGGDRPDLHGRRRLHLVVADLFQAFAARNRGFQHLRIVQRVPHDGARRGNTPLPGHIHGIHPLSGGPEIMSWVATWQHAARKARQWPRGVAVQPASTGPPKTSDSPSRPWIRRLPYGNPSL